MIPILGCPVLNRRDLFDQMRASVDVPVEKWVVVDNSPDHLIDYIAVSSEFVVISARHNLGPAASWNLIVKSAPLAPWWMIVSNDLVFAPGDLARLADYMNAATGPAFAMLMSPNAFGINAAAVEQVGFWDENFTAYFEDNDMAWRLHLAGIHVEPLPAGYTHVGSATIRSDLHLAAENSRTFPVNERYYEAKWGGLPRHERFTTPFDAGGSPKDWALDFERLRRLTWR